MPKGRSDDHLLLKNEWRSGRALSRPCLIAAPRRPARSPPPPRLESRHLGAVPFPARLVGIDRERVGQELRGRAMLAPATRALAIDERASVEDDVDSQLERRRTAPGPAPALPRSVPTSHPHCRPTRFMARFGRRVSAVRERFHVQALRKGLRSRLAYLRWSVGRGR
jgi:hypothetical protein